MIRLYFFFFGKCNECWLTLNTRISLTRVNSCSLLTGLLGACERFLLCAHTVYHRNQRRFEIITVSFANKMITSVDLSEASVGSGLQSHIIVQRSEYVHRQLLVVPVCCLHLPDIYYFPETEAIAHLSIRATSIFCDERRFIGDNYQVD